MAIVQALKHRQSFADREEILQRGILELNAGLLPETASGRVTEVQNLARRRLSHAFDNLDGRCLAGTVRSQQAETGAFSYAEADAVDGEYSRISFRQVADFECGRHAQRG